MIRLQRRRTKGWRMPEGAVYVGRPTRWGNPFRIDAAASPRFTPEEATSLYRAWLVERDFRARVRGEDWLRPLRGATALVCWCPPEQPCHADALVALLVAEALTEALP